MAFFLGVFFFEIDFPDTISRIAVGQIRAGSGMIDRWLAWRSETASDQRH